MKRLCAYCLLFFLVAFQQSWASDTLDAAIFMNCQGITEKAEPAPAALTEEERAWLKRHAPFRIGVDPDYAPYEYVDEYGQHRGIAMGRPVQKVSRWVAWISSPSHF